jgi:hypothetical protein
MITIDKLHRVLLAGGEHVVLHTAKVGVSHQLHSHGLTLRPSTKVDRLRPYARAVPHAGLPQSCNCTTMNKIANQQKIDGRYLQFFVLRGGSTVPTVQQLSTPLSLSTLPACSHHRL